MSFLYGDICTWCSIILIIALVILSITKKMQKMKIAVNIILFIYGLLGSFTLPSYLMVRLGRSHRVDKDFIKWASVKFYDYSLILAAITLIILALAIVIFIFSKKVILGNLKLIMVFGQISLIVIAFLLGLNTINKKFDLAIFILNMSYFNALVLFGINIFDNLTRRLSYDKINN